MIASLRTRQFRRLLSRLRDATGIEFGFVLWDGSTVPENLRRDEMAITIRDQNAVKSLLKRPTAETVADLWLAGRIDLLNGSLFDLAAAKPIPDYRDMQRGGGRVSFAISRLLFLPVAAADPGLHSAGGRKVRLAGGTTLRDTTDFHRLFLDPDLVQGAGYFKSWTNNLEAAQRDKLDMVCRKLRIERGNTLLDIGCGWGALACHAAMHHGARVFGIAGSAEQALVARDRAEAMGLSDRITIEYRSPEEIDGRFDRVASVGLFENLAICDREQFFASIGKVLKPGGLFLHEALSLTPGSEDDGVYPVTCLEALIGHLCTGDRLAPLAETVARLEQHGFELHDVESSREHGRLTTRLWHDRLERKGKEAEDLIGSEQLRLWEATLAACSLAFERGTLGLVQILASSRRGQVTALPPTRADLYRRERYTLQSDGIKTPEEADPFVPPAAAPARPAAVASITSPPRPPLPVPARPASPANALQRTRAFASSIPTGGQPGDAGRIPSKVNPPKS